MIDLFKKLRGDVVFLLVLIVYLFHLLTDGVGDLFHLITGNKVLVFDRKDAVPGTYRRVRVTDCTAATLLGELVG